MLIKCYCVFTTIVLFSHFHDGYCDSGRKADRYLAHIFRKYGSQGTLSFEGLEHLMHNLGLGGLEFNPSHTLDEHRPSGFHVPELIIDDDFEFNHEYPVDTHKHAVANDKHEMDNNNNNNNSDETAATSSDGAQGISTILKNANRSEADETVGSIYDNKQENIFKLLHDPSHRHPRHHDHGSISMKKCLSPLSIVELFVPLPNRSSIMGTMYKASFDSLQNPDQNDAHDVNKNAAEYASHLEITPINFMKLCPALIAQIEEGSCSERPAPESSHHEVTSFAWIAATIAITIISLCGLVGIAMVPLTKFVAYQEILRFLIACAIGTLCGDALMHLLPHALMPHDEEHTKLLGTQHNDDHEEDKDVKAILLCSCAFLAALIMYSIEALLPLISGHGHTHNHSHEPKRGNAIDVYQQPTGQNPENTVENGAPNNANGGSNSTVNGEETDIDMEISKKSTEEKVMVKDTKNKVRPEMSAVAFMVVIGDGLHNLTDGLAIGAAFGADPVTGMATALAVLCHELPHELGDFALLLQTGVSIRRAVFLNIVSSILSFIGMIFGLFIVGINTEFVRWIYAATSGTFLYIALADLVPELGKSSHTVKTVVIQISGILLGGIIMLLIALYEESLKLLFK